MIFPYTLTAVVEHGKKLGRRLGAPTVNLRFPADKPLPEFGVYAVRAFINGREYPAVANVGIRPTVESCGETVCEVHIMDFSGDLYGKRVRVVLDAFLRPEKHFKSCEELRDSIELDIKKAREYYAGQVRQ